MLHWKTGNLFLMLIIGLWLEHPNRCPAQIKNQNADSIITRINPDTLRMNYLKELKNMGGEIELSEINIEAVIEKPRVAILPKRMQPELGDIEFINRSFENELKKAPDKLMIMDDRLLLPKKIENLRQKLLETKKDLNKN